MMPPQAVNAAGVVATPACSTFTPAHQPQWATLLLHEREHHQSALELA